MCCVSTSRPRTAPSRLLLHLSLRSSASRSTIQSLRDERISPSPGIRKNDLVRNSTMPLSEEDPRLHSERKPPPIPAGVNPPPHTTKNYVMFISNPNMISTISFPCPPYSRIHRLSYLDKLKDAIVPMQTYSADHDLRSVHEERPAA